MSDQTMINKMLDARILFLGPPGSGKGTQCKHLHAELGLPHLSTGDILRHGIEEGKPACLQAKSYIDKGNLVPDNLITSIFKERFMMPDCGHGFILDGYPRTVPQAESLDGMLKELRLPLTCVFYLMVDDQLIIERTTGRLSCSNSKCGAVYHIKNSPPQVAGICDVCGSVLKQRSDDNVEIVTERLKVYKEQTAPVIQYYRDKGVLQEINGARSQEEIYTDLIGGIRSCATAGGR